MLGSMATVYDLEERTLRFAADVRELVRIIPKSIANQEDGRQLIRSSGSVGANYIEANEGLGVKDFLMRLKISRKEAKESRFWLNLIKTHTSGQELERKRLLQEAMEFVYIITSIISKIPA